MHDWLLAQLDTGPACYDSLTKVYYWTFSILFFMHESINYFYLLITCNSMFVTSIYSPRYLTFLLDMVKSDGTRQVVSPRQVWMWV
jgi:hypothetical protein